MHISSDTLHISQSGTTSEANNDRIFRKGGMPLFVQLDPLSHRNATSPESVEMRVRQQQQVAALIRALEVENWMSTLAPPSDFCRGIEELPLNMDVVPDKTVCKKAENCLVTFPPFPEVTVSCSTSNFCASVSLTFVERPKIVGSTPCDLLLQQV